MDKLTAIKIKYDDGTYSDEIPVSVLSENVEWDSTHTLVDVLGSIDVDITGTIQDQISQLFNEKVSNSDMQAYVTNSMPTYITNWLNTNVNPVGSAVVVDSSLNISGAAADAKVVGDKIADLDDLKSTLNEVSEIYNNLIDWSDLQIGKNWTGGTASNRAVLYIPVEPSTEYYVEVPTNQHISAIQAIEKAQNTGASANLHLTGIVSGDSTTITTTENTHYFCLQFDGNTTLAESDFANYNLCLIKGSQKELTAIDIKTRNKISEISEFYSIADLNNLFIGVNRAGQSASDRAVLFVPVLPSTNYYVYCATGTVINGLYVEEKKESAYADAVIASHSCTLGKDNTFTTNASTKFLEIQFSGSTTLTESDFTGLNFIVNDGDALEYTAVDKSARDILNNSHNTFRELAEAMRSTVQRVGGYEFRPIMDNLQIQRSYQKAIGASYYDVNAMNKKYECINYHKKIKVKNIFNQLSSEEIDFTPSNNGFTRVVVGKNSNDVFFVSYVASNRLGVFGDPKYDALEITTDFVNFRTILRSDALASGDGIPLSGMTNIKVKQVKEFADGHYLLAIQCHNIEDNNDYTHFYRMASDFSQIHHCNYVNFDGNTVPMIDEFMNDVYDWSIFIVGNKGIATTYGNRKPETDYGRVWYTENGGGYWKQVFQTNNHYQDGQAEGVTVTQAHTHGVMLDNINDVTTRMFVIVGEDSSNVFWTDKGTNATDNDWNVIDVKNQPFYNFQSGAQVVNGYPFQDGLLFGSDNVDVGCIYRVNKLDDGSYSKIESVHELLPNEFNLTSYCAADLSKRDTKSPLLMCFTREGARFTESDTEALNKNHKARVIATYDGVNFIEVWSDDTYGSHDVYIDGSVVQRNYSYCTRGMNCWLLKNGDVVIKYAGRDYYYFGGNPLFSVSGLSNGSCKVKWIKNAEQYL